MTDEMLPTKPLTPMQYILYKLDRTLAILGIIGIAMGALFMLKVADAQQITIAAIGVLGGYIGGRTGKQ